MAHLHLQTDGDPLGESSIYASLTAPPPPPKKKGGDEKKDKTIDLRGINVFVSIFIYKITNKIDLDLEETLGGLFV